MLMYFIRKSIVIILTWELYKYKQASELRLQVGLTF